MTTTDGTSTDKKQKGRDDMKPGQWIDHGKEPFDSEEDVREFEKMLSTEKRKLEGKQKVEDLQKEGRLPS